MNDLELLKTRVERERTARKAAEQLLEDKSLELYLSNKDLEAHSNEIAEQKEELQKKVEELQQARSRLVQSEKMAAVGQLAAGIAHEINNPVGFISSKVGSLNEY
jgi:C4-dicarboxylate-specific signal transduction histidine kinase